MSTKSDALIDVAKRSPALRWLSPYLAVRRRFARNKQRLIGRDNHFERTGAICNGLTVRVRGNGN